MFNKRTINLLTPPLIAVFFFFSLAAASQAPDPAKQVKDFLNDKIEAVHKADTPAEKRRILNATFDTFIKASEKAIEDARTPEEAVLSLKYLKNHFIEKKAELNGTGDFVAVADSQLDNFATFVQQDTEQAFLSMESMWDYLLIWLIGFVVIMFIFYQAGLFDSEY